MPRVNGVNPHTQQKVMGSSGVVEVTQQAGNISTVVDRAVVL
jgi:hypothetical protein